jgi:hypothetical protein
LKLAPSGFPNALQTDGTEATWQTALKQPAAGPAHRMTVMTASEIYRAIEGKGKHKASTIADRARAVSK